MPSTCCSRSVCGTTPFTWADNRLYDYVQAAARTTQNNPSRAASANASVGGALHCKLTCEIVKEADSSNLQCRPHTQSPSSPLVLAQAL